MMIKRSSENPMLSMMFITDSPEMAAFVASCGVDIVFFDLEWMGKAERQGHLDTVISRHDSAALPAVRAAIPNAKLLVRLNPVHSGSRDEVESALDAGADLLMLPMFRSAEELAFFSSLVAGRAGVIPLLETAEAMHDIDRVVTVPGLCALHIGLNDLHLSLGRTFMFELLVDGTTDRIAEHCRAAGLRFGIGGIARPDEGLVPADGVLRAHARIGSSMAILSRTFHRRMRTVAEIRADFDMAATIAALRLAYDTARRRSSDEVEADHASLTAKIEEVSAAMLNNRKEKARTRKGGQ